MPEDGTDRLILRRWRDDDRPAFAAMNSDPEVMRYLGPLMTRAESDAFVDRIEAAFEANGYGLWAVEVRRGAPFIGYVGLLAPAFEAAFTPCVEVGWRIASTHWGKGYAPEAAREALRRGFEEFGLDEIVSFTTVENTKSRRVMEKIGMRHDAAHDFDHPRLAAGNPLRPHVLYRISAFEFAERDRLLGA